MTDFWNNQKPERALQKLVGKGLRIMAYTGFDAEGVVIPAKIGGLPVVSIGEKVFKNTTVSEVILPGSIKAILGGAFSGCKRLQHIGLPDGLEYLGSRCFAGSGLTALRFPDRLKTIPEGCCGGCANLCDVTFGQQVQTIQGSAFHACKKLQTVSFPESLLRANNDAFEKTAITRFIFPAGVQEVGDVKHSHFYIEPRYPAFDRTISDRPDGGCVMPRAALRIPDSGIFIDEKNRRFPLRKRRFLFVFAQNLMLAGLRSNMVLTCL